MECASININGEKIWLGRFLMKAICCFCGDEILRSEKDPLVLNLQSDGTDEEYREGEQSFHCHALCFEKRLYDRDVPFMWFAEEE